VKPALTFLFEGGVMIKAILVDAHKREVRVVQIDGENHQEISKLLGCDFITSALRLKNSVGFCDDRGLLNGTEVGAKYKSYPEVIMGNMIFIGIDPMGDSVETDLCMEEVEREIERYIGDCSEKECVLCGGMSMDEFFMKMMKNIEKHGINITGIPSRGFNYTTGMVRVGFSDIIVFGVSMEMAKELFNHIYSEISVKGRVFKLNERENGIIMNLPVMFLEIEPKVAADGYLTLSKLYSDVTETEYKSCQLVLPDMNGKFPWEEGFDNGCYQPLIGKVKK
jgi:hypothetical protein